MRRSTSAAFALLAIALSGCKKTSDEDLVRAVIERAIQAANDKKAGDVVADAAEGFKGPRGQDLGECRRILVGMFMRQGWILVMKQDLEVKVEGTRATAKLEALVAQGNEIEKPADLVPTNADALTFDLELEKQGDDWKLTKAEYRRTRPL